MTALVWKSNGSKFDTHRTREIDSAFTRQSVSDDKASSSGNAAQVEQALYAIHWLHHIRGVARLTKAFEMEISTAL